MLHYAPTMADRPRGGKRRHVKAVVFHNEIRRNDQVVHRDCPHTRVDQDKVLTIFAGWLSSPEATVNY